MVRFLVWGVAHPPAKDRDPTTNYTLEQLRVLADKYAGKPARLMHSPEDVGEVIFAWVNEKKRRLEALFSVEGPGIAPHLARTAVAKGYYTGLSIGAEMAFDFNTFEVKKDRDPVELSLCPLRLARRGPECRVLWSNASRQQSTSDIKRKGGDDRLFDVSAEKLDTDPRMAELKKLVDMVSETKPPPPPPAQVPPTPPSPATQAPSVDPKEYEEMKKTLEALKQQEKERDVKKEAKLKAKVEEERQKRLKRGQEILASAQTSLEEMQALGHEKGVANGRAFVESIDAKLKTGDISSADLEQCGAAVTFMDCASSTVAVLIEKATETNKRLKTENTELSARAKILEEKHEEARARLDARRGGDTIQSRLAPTPAAAPPAPAAAAPTAAAAKTPAADLPPKSDRLRRLFDQIRGEETEEKTNPVVPKTEAKAAPAATPPPPPALKATRADDPQVIPGGHISVHPRYSSDVLIDKAALGAAAPPVPALPSPFKAADGTVMVPTVRALEGGGGLQEANPTFYHWIKEGSAGEDRTGMDIVNFDNLRGKRFYGASDISDKSGNWKSSREPEAMSFTATPIRQPAAAAAAGGRRIGV